MYESMLLAQVVSNYNMAQLCIVGLFLVSLLIELIAKRGGD